MKPAPHVTRRESAADHLREVAPSPSTPDAGLDVAWEPTLQGRRRTLASWNEYMAIASRVVGRFHGQFQQRHFDYHHPTWLQPGTPRRLRAPYVTPAAYTDWGPADAPLLLCCGGVANVAMRFHYLASDLSDRWRVICMDWVGRGRSGWLAAEDDYSLATYSEQLRQMILHLGDGHGARRVKRPVTVLGSSLGGSAAIELVARHPQLVQRLILNDVGPHIPARRRRRRAETIARHYVFRQPADLLRRIGAANKNDGPVSDDIRFNLSFHQTRWSEEEGGRVYRHDVRAMQAYRKQAQRSLLQWAQWQRVRCPVLLIHGMQSDALLEATIRRMGRSPSLPGPLAVMHVPDTGHTPLLADRNQIGFVRQWLDGQAPEGSQWSVLHAAPRDAFPGNPIPFAPAHALR